MSDPRYDITLADPVSGESIGLKLDAPFQWQSAQQMATRITEAQDWRSFDEWSVLEQSSFHHGRGLEIWDSSDPERYYDSYNIDTRIRDQMTLAPKSTTTSVGAAGFLDYHLYNYHSAYSTNKLAQSFKCVSHTCKKIAIKAKATGSSAITCTLRVETDDPVTPGQPSGTLVSPSGVVSSATASVPATFGWVEFDFGSTGFTLGDGVGAGDDRFWLVLVGGSSSVAVFWWGGDGWSDPYALGTSMEYSVSTWSEDVDFDFFFDLRSASNMADVPRCFTRMGTKFYCGAGTAVYQWDNSNKYWVAKKTDFANSVTDMVEFAGVLWVAHGDGNLWTLDGTSTWAEKSGVTATFLLVYKGYLYRSTYSTDNLVFYTADGATWNASGWKVGNPGRLERIRGLVGYEYDVYVLTTHGLYVLGPESRQGDLVDQIVDYSTQYDDWNGIAGAVWPRDGKLYFNVGASLLSYQEGLLDSVGPNKDAGLPSGRQGIVESTVALSNWLVASVDAGSSGTSSVLVYNGSGWHELFRAPGVGQVARALGYDTTATPYKLWFGFGNQAGYIEFPDTTDNPYEYSSSAYASQGYLITPWIDMDLLSVDKDFQEFGVQCDMPSTCTLTVSYQVDRYRESADVWYQLYSATSTDMDGVYAYTFPFESAFATNPTVTAGSTRKTINVDALYATVLTHWLRINDEIRVATTAGANYLTLTRALSAAPAAGDRVYPARPCGAEIRFKIELATTNSAYTPKLQAWWLKCMPMIKDKLAASFSSQIYDGQTDYPQAPEILASTRAALLHSFAKRPTPIDLTDMAGDTKRVKITDLKETQEWASGQAMGHDRTPIRTFVLSVVEV
ncbi:MAG: hypothetical protein WC683_08685 [bacterium]